MNVDQVEDGHAVSAPTGPSKICRRCRKTLPESSFHRRGAGRRMTLCRQCRSRERTPRQESPQERLERKLRCEYGLSFAQYLSLAEAQNGLCAICKKSPGPKTRLYVDHCHDTGVVRALLCNKCNLNVGVYEAQHHAFAAYLATYGDGNPLLKE